MLFLFSTLLNKLFHITDVYIYSTRQNKNWIHKKLPHSKVYIPLNLNNLCCFLDDLRPFFCVVIVVHESLVDPEQFNYLLFFRQILQLLHTHWFSSNFCIIEAFPTVTVWFGETPFHTEGNWGTNTQLLQKVGYKHLLMLRKATECIKNRGCKLLNRDDDVQMFLILF